MKLIKAILWGKKVVCTDLPVGNDLGCKVTGYYYKDVMYIIKVKFFKPKGKQKNWLKAILWGIITWNALLLGLYDWVKKNGAKL